MRVGLGVILGVQGGPARYGFELVRHLRGAEGDLELVVFTDRPGAFTALNDSRLRVVEVAIRHPWEQGVWDLKLIPVLRREKLDLYHGTKGILPPLARLPCIVTIHDLSVFHLPQTFSWLQRLQQVLLLPRTVRLAKRIIADSEHAAEDIRTTFRLSKDSIRVIPLAAAQVFHPRATAADRRCLAELGVDIPYVLFAGTLQPRKGLEDLIESFLPLLGQHPTLTLVLAGRIRPGYRPSFLQTRPGGVRYVGEVSDEQLAALYRQALVFCSPSRYEGFGLSFLEAMQSGCPVVAPCHTSIPEVVGDAAYSFGDGGPTLAEALRAVVGSALLRQKLRAAGLEQARRFQWSKTAAMTIKVYREVLHG